MTNLLLKNGADPNAKAKNGLAPMHLCAQDDRVNVAAILAASGADLNAETKAGYTPLHVACHFGSVNMVRFLLERDVNIDVQVGSLTRFLLNISFCSHINGVAYKFACILRLCILIFVNNSK